MTWHTDQISVSDSAPVDLYEFVTPQTTYYRTSFQEDYAFGGNTYVAVPMIRSEVPVEPPGESHPVTIELPVSDVIIQENFVGFPAVPRTLVTVSMYRLQQLSGTRVLWWTGPVRGVSLTNKGRVARLSVPDGLEDKLRSSLPRARCQRLCNHSLYDSMCQVVEASFSLATTVASIDGSIVQVAAVTGGLDYTMGIMLFDGERRGIVVQGGTNLTLDAPFRGLSIGGAVTISAGCDHTVVTCRDTYNNVLNFGGHPQLPLKNPHILRLV